MADKGGGRFLHRQSRAPVRNCWSLVLVGMAWFLLWSLTPGLLSSGVGSLVTEDLAGAVLVETLLALVLGVPLILLHGRFNRALFAHSKLVYLYALPVLLGAVLPLHYGLPLPVGLYIVWMTVSVFWQDYLTFGLLQSYLSLRMRPRVVVPIVAVMFTLGHVVLLPDRFALVNFLPVVSILALGLFLAFLRARLGTIHMVLALHLAFYFIFA